MKYLQNLHTHTTFCDGKNTAEELVLKALELGFDSIGFSVHSPVPTNLDYYIPEKDIPEYKKEIARLKQVYGDRIDILCGIEYDMFSNTSQAGYDYIIGANHHIMIDGEVIDMDQNAENFKVLIDKYFNGNGIEFAKKYFETSCEIPDKVNADFIAHIDLLSKNCETTDIIDINSKEYKAAALEAVHTISRKINIFEVNTGAISRGYRTTPYPAPFILKEINKTGGHVVITSDCHNADYLNCKFDFAKELVASCGFKEIYVLTKNGFQGISIK